MPLIEQPIEESNQQPKTVGVGIGGIFLIYIIAAAIKYFTGVNLLSLYVLIPFLAVCAIVATVIIKQQNK